MKHFFSCLVILFFTVGHLSYSREIVQDSVTFNSNLKKIDSLFNLEHYEQARVIAIHLLPQIASSDSRKLSICNYLIGGSFLYTSKYDSAVHYQTIAFDYAKKAKDTYRIIKSGSALLYLYNRLINYSTARTQLFNELEVVYKGNISIKEKTILLDAFADYYDVSGQQGRYLETLIASVELRQLNFKSKSKTNTAFDSTNLGVSFLNIGETYVDLNQMEKAQEYLALARIWIKNYDQGLCHYYKNMALVHLYLKQENVAESYIDSILKLQKRSGNDLTEIIISGDIVLMRHYLYDHINDKKVDYYYQQAKKYASGTTDKIILGQLNFETANLLIKKKKFATALTYLEPLEQQAKDWKMNEYARFVKITGDCYFNIGAHFKANQFYRQYNVLEDSIINQINRKNRLEAEAKFQNETKQLKIAQQQKIITLAHKNTILLSLAFLIVLTLLIWVLFIYRNKRYLFNLLKQSQLELTKLNSELDESNVAKSKLIGIISHDFREPISQIHQLLSLQHSNVFISPEEQQSFEKQIRSGAINLLDSMEDLLIWSKTQMQSLHPVKTIVDIKSIYKQCTRLLQTQIQNKEIQIEEIIPPICKITTDPNFLLTILRNLLHNAIKASPQNGIIMFKCELSESRHEIGSIIIVNEGPVFTQADYLEALEDGNTSHLLVGGLGLKVADELSRKIDMEISFGNNNSQHETRCFIKFH